MVFDDQTDNIRESTLKHLIPGSHMDGNILIADRWSTDLENLDVDINQLFPETRMRFERTPFIKSSNIHLLPQPIIAEHLRVNYDASYIRCDVYADIMTLDMCTLPYDDELKYLKIDRCNHVHIIYPDQYSWGYLVQLTTQTLNNCCLLGSDVSYCNYIEIHRGTFESAVLANKRTTTLNPQQERMILAHPERCFGDWVLIDQCYFAQKHNKFRRSPGDQYKYTVQQRSAKFDILKSKPKYF